MMILDGPLSASSPTWRRKHVAPVVRSWTSLGSVRVNQESDEMPAATSGTNRLLVERRTWLQQTTNAAVVTASAGLLGAAQAWADDVEAPLPSVSAQSVALPSKLPRSPLQATKALCDPTVSVWQLGNTGTAATGNAGRTVVLLGTAHISQLSAELAGTLVREIRPDAVFVELDLKRVARIGSTGSSSSTASGGPPGLLDATDSMPVQVIVPSPQRLLPPPPPPPPSMSVDGTATTESSSSSSSSLVAPPSPSGGNKGNWFTRGAMNLAANAVGNAVKGLYSNLSTAGFQPGEEFATAIRAGQDVGAAIVLGDQDVQVTLRRLTQALAVTDLDKLLSPNSALEKSMAELLPPPPSSSAVAAAAVSDSANFKQELTDYVERMKSRDSVRKLMAELQDVAPALIQVMLTERDAYMAAGLDTLSQFDCIVAVMGIAHQDGVERNLRERGWKALPLSCAPYTV
jgi:TraB/PrgY/gumN family